MTRSRKLLALVILTAGLVNMRQGWAETKDAPADSAAAPLKVLFIGNSLTYCNNLPDMLRVLAAHAPKPLAMDVEAVTVGGAKLELHWNKGEALKKIQQGGWTHVVLQDLSTIALTDKESLFKHIRLFDAEIKKTGAKTLLYMTWALRGKPETQSTITSAYLDIGRELGARVIPVGVVRASVLKSDPSAAIYVPDGKHPSPGGTYLAACLFYAMLSGQSPKGLPAIVLDPKDGKKTLVKLTDAEAELYQRIAEDTARAVK